MKSIVLIALIFVIFSCSEKKANIQNEAKKEKASEGQIPRIEFEEEMHDFGKIKAGEIVSYSFQFTKSGDTDLIIKDTETDCTCIEAEISENVVAQGKKGIIEVKFNSAGLFGKQLKTIEIQSNCKETKHLIIFAEVENEQIEFKN